MADIKVLDAEAAKAEVEAIAKNYVDMIGRHVNEIKRDLVEAQDTVKEMPKTASDLMLLADVALSKTIDDPGYINHADIYRVNLGIDTRGGSANFTMYYTDHNANQGLRLKKGVKYRALVFLVPVGPLDEKEPQ